MLLDLDGLSISFLDLCFVLEIFGNVIFINI